MYGGFYGFFVLFFELKGQSLVDILDEQRRKEDLHWTLIFSNVIAQWAQWLGQCSLKFWMLDFVFSIFGCGCAYY